MEVWNKGFFSRVWVTFIALIPFLEITNLSISMAAVDRARLIVCRAAGAVLLGTAFFATSADTLSWRSDAACAAKDLGDHILQDMFVGIVAFFVSFLPVLVCSCVHCNYFVKTKGWDDRRRKRQLSRPGSPSGPCP